MLCAVFVDRRMSDTVRSTLSNSTLVTEHSYTEVTAVTFLGCRSFTAVTFLGCRSFTAVTFLGCRSLTSSGCRISVLARTMGGSEMCGLWCRLGVVLAGGVGVHSCMPSHTAGVFVVEVWSNGFSCCAIRRWPRKSPVTAQITPSRSTTLSQCSALHKCTFAHCLHAALSTSNFSQCVSQE